MGRKRETLYLAYGSNMNQTQMALRCPTARVVGISQLKGYELLFRGSRHRGAEGGQHGACASLENS